MRIRGLVTRILLGFGLFSAPLSILAGANGQLVLMTYNVDGNSITGTSPTNWAVTAPQVQAIGREITYLNPDIITFNEIPSAYMWQMTNWAQAFLTNYFLATNSIGDGFIQNCIASRYPILNSASHLHGSSLSAYGYSGSFTRDLFEGVISVSNYAVPLHVFVAHLKATTSSPQSDANKRAAEASAISNYFVTVFLPGASGSHPYVLDGDLNESALFPETNNYVSGHPIQRVTAAATGLQYTDPLNSITQTDLTESIRGPLDTRFDYILPSALMYSNIVSSQVFRTDLLSPLPPNLNGSDDSVASDHLPVLMTFSNPYDSPFRMLSIRETNYVLTLQWESLAGRQYEVQASEDMANWSPLATNLIASGTNLSFTTNSSADMRYFRIYRSP